MNNCYQDRLTLTLVKFIDPLNFIEAVVPTKYDIASVISASSGSRTIANSSRSMFVNFTSVW